MLEVTDLTKAYGRGPAAYTAVTGISFAVAEGELVSIVGPSGCGKSTLLRCVAGLIPPTSGHVALRGAPVTDVPDGLAVVLQDYSRSLFPWLTVRDNVAIPLRHTIRSRAARRSAADASLAAVGLPGVGGKYPWQLSGGMQQRAAIARALAASPALLLMDEPFGSVDAQTREDLEDLVLNVRAEHGITILVVTHDIDESVYLGDRVIVLTPGPGRIRADLPVELPAPRDQIETKELPQFVQLRTEVSRLVRSRDEHEDTSGKTSTEVDADADAVTDAAVADVAADAVAVAAAADTAVDDGAVADADGDTDADSNADAVAEAGAVTADADADADATGEAIPASAGQDRA